MSICVCACVVASKTIQLYYPGISYGVDAGVQAVLASKLPLHPCVTVALPVPASIRVRITYPELRVLVVYVAMLLKGTHTKKEII